jgi:hypothetical protein
MLPSPDIRLLVMLRMMHRPVSRDQHTPPDADDGRVASHMGLAHVELGGLAGDGDVGHAASATSIGMIV